MAQRTRKPKSAVSTDNRSVTDKISDAVGRALGREKKKKKPKVQRVEANEELPDVRVYNWEARALHAHCTTSFGQSAVYGRLDWQSKFENVLNMTAGISDSDDEEHEGEDEDDESKSLVPVPPADSSDANTLNQPAADSVTASNLPGNNDDSKTVVLVPPSANASVATSNSRQPAVVNTDDDEPVDTSEWYAVDPDKDFEDDDNSSTPLPSQSASATSNKPSVDISAAAAAPTDEKGIPTRARSGVVTPRSKLEWNQAPQSPPIQLAELLKRRLGFDIDVAETWIGWVTYEPSSSQTSPPSLNAANAQKSARSTSQHGQLAFPFRNSDQQ